MIDIRFCKSLLASALLASVTATPSSAVETEAQIMTALDFLSLPRLSAPRLSPGGEYLSYELTETNWSDNTSEDQVYVIRLADGHRIDLPPPGEDEDPVDNLVWAPDGQGFLTVMELEGDDHNQIYVYRFETGLYERVTEHGASVSQARWSNDGRSILFRAEAALSDLDQHQRRKGWVLTPYDVDEHDQLWQVSLSDRQVTPLTQAQSGHMRGYSMSRDGQSILYVNAPGTRIDDRHQGELWRLSLETGDHEQLTANTYAEVDAALAPSGNAFAFIATVNAQGEPYYEDNLFIQQIGDRQPELILPDTPMEILDVQWDETGDGVYFLGNSGVRTQLYHYDIETEALTALTNGDHVVSQWRFDAASGLHSFIIITASAPGEVWVGSADEGFETVTNIYGDLSDRFALPRQEAVTWRGRGGQLIEGLLVHPIGPETQAPAPLVTIIHGGPLSSSQFGSWNRSRYIAVLAGQGYAVLLPNHRGGTGYGDDFARDMVGGYFTNAQHDVMDGVDAMIERGVADPDQLVIMGWSAGGHMTNKLITMTDRFAAASSGAGASEWISMVGESDTRAGRIHWFGSEPWDREINHRTYRRHSPLYDAWRVTTPTLFFVGEDDVRVPPTQSILMHRAVADTGTPTQLYQAPGQPHNFRRPSYQLFKINTELTWYAEHLGRTYTPSLPEAAREIENADDDETVDE